MADRDTSNLPNIAERVSAVPSEASASVVARFGVFRDRRAQVALRAGVAGSGQVDPVYARATGMNLGKARRLTGTRGIFAVPAKDAVCVIDESGGGACTPSSEVGKDFGTVRCAPGMRSGEVRISGLIADGTGAKVRLASGRLLDLPAANNYAEGIVAAAADDPPAAVVLTQGGNESTVPLPAPAADETACATQ